MAISPYARRGTAETPLLVCIEGVLVEAASLRHGYGDGGAEPPALDALRERAERALAELDHQSRSLGLDAEAAEAAGLAVAAFVDEAVIASQACDGAQWLAEPLQMGRFGDQAGGQRFFDRLEGLLRRVDPPLPVLEVYLACLQLGFQGVYAVEDPERPRRESRELAARVAELRGRDRGASASLGAGSGARRLQLRGRSGRAIRAGVIAAALVAILAPAWVAERQLHAAATVALEHVEAARDALGEAP